MAIAGLDRLNLDKPLPVGDFQLPDDLPDRRHDRSHRERQTIDSAFRVLATTKVVHLRIVDRDGEVMPLPSVRDAELQLEAIDVLDGEYAAFGVDGRVLALRAVGDDVILTGTEGWDLAGLRTRIRDYHGRTNLESDQDDVVAVVNELFRRQWEARLPKWPRWLDRRLHGHGPAQV